MLRTTRSDQLASVKDVSSVIDSLVAEDPWWPLNSAHTNCLVDLTLWNQANNYLCFFSCLANIHDLVYRRKDGVSSVSRVRLGVGVEAELEADMSGVTAHYLNEQPCVKTVLLGPRPTYGADRGVANDEELLTVMRDSSISDWVGYFVAENASNNDVALRQIAKAIDIDPL
jgi:hypothetical protein